MQKINIAIFDESLFFRESIQNHLQQDVNLQIIGKAANPHMASNLLNRQLPDLLIADVNFEKKHGTNIVKMLLSEGLPVIIVGEDHDCQLPVAHGHAARFIRKPDTVNSEAGRLFFLRLFVAIREMMLNWKSEISFPVLSSVVVAIGASTGGADAIEILLSKMPPLMPPIVVSQHMSAGFTAAFAERLNRRFYLSVKEASDGDRLIPGQVYVAPGNRDMVVVNRKNRYNVNIHPPDPERIAHPNIDLLFESVADSKIHRCVGILLTGMGKDGASGLYSMKEAGYMTIVQDQETSVVYGMPRAAMEMGAGTCQLPLHRITEECIKQLLH